MSAIIFTSPLSSSKNFSSARCHSFCNPSENEISEFDDYSERVKEALKELKICPEFSEALINRLKLLLFYPVRKAVFL